MHRKPVFPAFAAALAALAAGCEWSGTSSSDSWSGSYDAMNFSGTYRSAATLTGGSGEGGVGISTTETVGSYSAGTLQYSGHLSHTPVNLASVQIQLGGITFSGDGSGNLVSDFGSGSITESGAWSVNVNGASTSSTGSNSGVATPINNEVIANGTFPGKTGNLTLKNKPIVEGSVTVFLDGGESVRDNGSNLLTSDNSGFGGTVEYTSGTITLDWSGAGWGDKSKSYATKIRASYSYYQNGSGSLSTSPSPLKGSGKIVAVYSYGAFSGSPMTTSSSDITAITVSQSGQNLTMTTNTGIQMTGRFTAVRETSGSEEAGVGTYNAQFQVTSAAGHKFVGTLNYDLPTSRRTLNGTLTAGKAVYDVQGVGPAFSSSAN